MGIIVNSDMEILFKSLIIVGLLIIICLIFILLKDKKRQPTSINKTDNQLSQSSARISRSSNDNRAYLQASQNIVTHADGDSKDSARIQSANKVENNSINNKIVNNKKTTSNTSNNTIPTKIVLINEEGHNLLEWRIDDKTSLIIGKSTDKEPVDIDLSGSAVAQMISKQHAVLNYTDNGWYIDDIDSKNGTRVRKISQNAILDVKLVGAVEVSIGDIIYIASTMLQLQ